MVKKIAIVTGVSSGFGQLIAIELSKLGYFVVGTIRNQALKSSVEQRFINHGLEINEHISIQRLDLNDDGTIVAFCKFVAQYGRLDLLVNNAGYALGGFFEELENSEIRKQFETNVFGTIRLTQLLLPMIRQARGTIIMMSSISGMIGFPGVSAYAASKHALEGFSESLRLELKPYGVYVVLVEPGSFQTNIWEKSERLLDNQRGQASPYEEYMNKLKTRMFGENIRFGDPVHVARLVAAISKKKQPRLRYTIGKGVSFSLLVKRLLPWRLWEKLVLNTILKK